MITLFQLLLWSLFAFLKMAISFHSFDNVPDREVGQSVTELMCKPLNQQNAPELDRDTFNGDPMEFHYFMAIFHEVVERKVDDAWRRLTQLNKIHQGWSQGDCKNLHIVTTWGWVQDCKEIAAWKIWRSTQNHSGISKSDQKIASDEG